MDGNFGKCSVNAPSLLATRGVSHWLRFFCAVPIKGWSGPLGVKKIVMLNKKFNFVVAILIFFHYK